MLLISFCCDYAPVLFFLTLEILMLHTVTTISSPKLRIKSSALMCFISFQSKYSLTHSIQGTQTATMSSGTICVKPCPRYSCAPSSIVPGERDITMSMFNSDGGSIDDCGITNLNEQDRDEAWLTQATNRLCNEPLAI